MSKEEIFSDAKIKWLFESKKDNPNLNMYSSLEISPLFHSKMFNFFSQYFPTNLKSSLMQITYNKKFVACF